jgi:hypothetical protein
MEPDALPLRTYAVAWASADGTFVGTPQKVQAQRVVMEQMGPTAVFLFQRVDEAGGFLNVLTAPYERVHSIDLVMEEDDGTSAAG